MTITVSMNVGQLHVQLVGLFIFQVLNYEEQIV